MSCLAGRTERYTFSASPRLACVIEAAPRLTDDAMFEQSLQIEPRGAFV
jgi:hypothetical protein